MARRVVIATAIVAVLACVGTAAGDPGDPGEEKARVDAELGEAREQLDEADTRTEVLTEELSTITARVRATADAVAAEEAVLAELEGRLAAQRAERLRIERRLGELRERLKVHRREERTALRRLALRVREIYMADDPDVVSFVLGAGSFTELIDNLDLLNRIGRQDERIAEAATRARTRTAASTVRVRAARAEAVAVERLIAGRTAEQRAVRDRLAAARDAAARAEQEKAGALAAVQEHRDDLASEIAALEAESAALAAKIQAAAAAGSASAVGPPSAAGLIWPVSGPVTSGFGPRWGRLHEGIDIMVPEGTPVRAAAAGVVIHAGWLGGYGNLVVVDHGGGLSTAYAHNSAYASSVGQQVGQGDVVAYSGNTGNSSGPHVHFEVRVNGVAVDPLGYL
jgi:murein DD-endopeptidase MepM/ murein hydrolase activator NlpD